MTIGERIKTARERLGLTRPDLAKAADIPYPTIAGLENSDQTSSTRLHVLAKVLAVRPEWLETGKGEMEAATSDDGENWAEIAQVPQDDPLPEDEYTEIQSVRFRADTLRRMHLRKGDLAIMRPKGSAMAPSIKDGASVLYDQSDLEPRDDKIYVVGYDGRLAIHRMMDLGGRWFITSDNTSDPRWRKPIAIEDLSDFAIHGRVRWVGSWED